MCVTKHVAARRMTCLLGIGSARGDALYMRMRMQGEQGEQCSSTTICKPRGGFLFFFFFTSCCNWYCAKFTRSVAHTIS